MKEEMASKSRELFERAKHVMPGGTSRSTTFLRPFPPYLVHGEGAWVTDVDGHRSIDCSNNYTALIHGHRHPEIVETVKQTMEWGISFGSSTPVEVEFAEVLAARYTSADHWRFANSGTEAVMQAMRIARAATGRDIVVRFGTSYHGTYDHVVSLESVGVPEATGDSVRILPLGDVDALREVFAYEGARIAAVLIDLMPNRAGMVPAEKEFVHLARELSSDHGSLLIIDEVISLRLSVGGFHTTYGVEPDLITLGKVIGGGFPIGAVGGTKDVMRVADPTVERPMLWGGTFSGNPVSLAAGMTALQLYDESEIDRLNKLGDALRNRLGAAGLIVTGWGSLMKVSPDRPIQDVWWPLYRAGIQITSSHMIALSTPMDESLVSEIGTRVIDTLVS